MRWALSTRTGVYADYARKECLAQAFPAHTGDVPPEMEDTCMARALYKTHGNAEEPQPLENPGPCMLLKSQDLGSGQLLPRMPAVPDSGGQSS